MVQFLPVWVARPTNCHLSYLIFQKDWSQSVKKGKWRHILIFHVFKSVSYYAFPRKCRLLTQSQGTSCALGPLSLGLLFVTLRWKRKKKNKPTLSHTFAAGNLNPVQTLYLACTQFKLPLLPTLCCSICPFSWVSWAYRPCYLIIRWKD